MTIIEDYLSLTIKYKEEYGNKTLLFTVGGEIDYQLDNSILPSTSSTQTIIGHTTTRDSLILFTTDTAGNRVAHLVGGDEKVSANNAIALGIAVKTDDTESPEDIEFVHTDGESYSVINGDSDSLGTNGLPIRQGFQAPPIGANPSPLLIDGGYF